MIKRNKRKKMWVVSPCVDTGEVRVKPEERSPRALNFEKHAKFWIKV